MESTILGFAESRIHLKESGIPLTIGIQNPSSTDKYWNPESSIQDCPGFPYMGRVIGSTPFVRATPFKFLSHSFSFILLPLPIIPPPPPYYTIVMNTMLAMIIHSCDVLAGNQALQGPVTEGQEKEGELATMSLEFEFHLQFPSGSLSTELSDFRQSARSRNEHECKQTLKNIINVISTNQHFADILHRLFRYREVAISPSFLPPRCQKAPESLLAG